MLLLWYSGCYGGGGKEGQYDIHPYDAKVDRFPISLRIQFEISSFSETITPATPTYYSVFFFFFD